MNLNPTLFDVLSARVNIYVNRWLAEELDTVESANQQISDSAKERLAKLKVIVNDIKVNTLYLRVGSAKDLEMLESTLRTDAYTKRFIDEGVIYLRLNSTLNELDQINAVICELLLNVVDVVDLDEHRNIMFSVLTSKPWLTFCFILRFTNLFDDVAIADGN